MVHRICNTVPTQHGFKLQVLTRINITPEKIARGIIQVMATCVRSCGYSIIVASCSVGRLMMRRKRSDCVRTIVALLISIYVCTGLVFAGETVETEPNNTPESANSTDSTVGAGQLSVSGRLDPLDDQDFFTFRVAELGIPDTPYSTAVRIEFTHLPDGTFFELRHVSGDVIFSTNATCGNCIFDFDPSTVGGLGEYLVQLGPGQTSSGDYRMSIYGVADGSGTPPVVIGTIPPVVLVQVSKTVDDPSPAAPLQTIEFTIKAVSTGSATANNVILQEILPPELEIPEGMAAFTTAGVYDQFTGLWSVGDLEPGQSELMTLPAIVVADPQPACIVNNVSMSIDDGDFSDRLASVSVRAAGVENCADMEVTVVPSSDLPGPCGVVGSFGYDVAVRNLGPDVARNVVMTMGETSTYKLPGFEFSDPACDGLTCRWDQVQPDFSYHVTARSKELESQKLKNHSISVAVTTDDEDYVAGNNDLKLSQDIEIPVCTPASRPDLDFGNIGAGGCFIATAAYGTPDDARIDILRNFRDRWLIISAPGRALVDLYYHVSPPVAEYIASRPNLRAGVRLALTPVLFALTHPMWMLYILCTYLGAVIGVVFCLRKSL